MNNEKKQRISSLAEEIYEVCENCDGATTLDCVDALTIVMNHLIDRLKENVGKGAAEAVVNTVKKNLKR